MENKQDDGMVEIPVSENFKKILEQMDPAQQEQAIIQVLRAKKRYQHIKKTLPPAQAARAVFASVQEYLVEAQSDPRIQCARGCAFCCRVNVDISEEEAACIIEYCQQRGMQINTERMQAQLGKDRSTWKDLSIADQHCAFLKDGLCSVYEVRPLACRKYFSTTRHLCENPFGETVVMTCNRTEIVASGVYAATKSGSLPEMILNQLANEKTT